MRDAGYVLVVEDDREIRQVIADVLAEEGHDVRTAADGRQALEMLGVGPPPALILLDLMMPIMNGAEFLDCKNRLPALSDVPVCIMTASSEAVQCTGVVGVLRKPFDIQTLMSIVERYCGVRSEDRGQRRHQVAG